MRSNLIIAYGTAHFCSSTFINGEKSSGQGDHKRNQHLEGYSQGFASNDRNVLSCLSALEAVLDGQGAAINRGAALPAAQSVLSER